MKSEQISAAQFLLSFMSDEQNRIAQDIQLGTFSSEMAAQRKAIMGNDLSIPEGGERLGKTDAGLENLESLAGKGRSIVEPHLKPLTNVGNVAESKMGTTNFAATVDSANPNDDLEIDYGLLNNMLGQFGVSANTRQKLLSLKGGDQRISLRQVSRVLNEESGVDLRVMSHGRVSGTEVQELMSSAYSDKGLSRAAQSAPALVRVRGEYDLNGFKQFMSDVSRCASQLGNNQAGTFDSAGEGLASRKDGTDAAIKQASPAADRSEQILDSALPSFSKESVGDGVEEQGVRNVDLKSVNQAEAESDTAGAWNVAATEGETLRPLEGSERGDGRRERNFGAVNDGRQIATSGSSEISADNFSARTEAPGNQPAAETVADKSTSISTTNLAARARLENGQLFAETETEPVIGGKAGQLLAAVRDLASTSQGALDVPLGRGSGVQSSSVPIGEGFALEDIKEARIHTGSAGWENARQDSESQDAKTGASFSGATRDSGSGATVGTNREEAFDLFQNSQSPTTGANRNRSEELLSEQANEPWETGVDRNQATERVDRSSPDRRDLNRAARNAASSVKADTHLGSRVFKEATRVSESPGSEPIAFGDSKRHSSTRSAAASQVAESHDTDNNVARNGDLDRSARNRAASPGKLGGQLNTATSLRTSAVSDDTGIESNTFRSVDPRATSLNRAAANENVEASVTHSADGLEPSRPDGKSTETLATLSSEGRSVGSAVNNNADEPLHADDFSHWKTNRNQSSDTSVSTTGRAVTEFNPKTSLRTSAVSDDTGIESNTLRSVDPQPTSSNRTTTDEIPEASATHLAGGLKSSRPDGKSSEALAPLSSDGRSAELAMNNDGIEGRESSRASRPENDLKEASRLNGDTTQGNRIQQDAEDPRITTAYDWTEVLDEHESAREDGIRFGGRDSARSSEQTPARFSTATATATQQGSGASADNSNGAGTDSNLNGDPGSAQGHVNHSPDSNDGHRFDLGLSNMTTAGSGSAQHATATEPRLSLNNPAWPTQLGEQFRTLQNQPVKQLIVKLEPENMGSLVLRMKTEHNKVVANITADSESARQMLLQNASALKQEMSEQGFVLGEFSVDVGSDERREKNRSNSPEPNGISRRSMGVEEASNQQSSFRKPIVHSLGALEQRVHVIA